MVTYDYVLTALTGSYDLLTDLYVCTYTYSIDLQVPPVGGSHTISGPCPEPGMSVYVVEIAGWWKLLMQPY